MYGSGKGVKQDFSQAKFWIEKAAAQGLDRAQHNLGVMYAEGKGVKQDLSQSKLWFERAAAQKRAGTENLLKPMADVSQPYKWIRREIPSSGLIIDTPGSRDIIIGPGIEYAGLRFTQKVTVSILRDGTLVATKEGITGTDQKGAKWVSRNVNIDGKKMNAFFTMTDAERSSKEKKPGLTAVPGEVGRKFKPDQALIKSSQDKAKELGYNPIPVFVDKKDGPVVMTAATFTIKNGQTTYVEKDMIINVGEFPVPVGGFTISKG